MTADPEIRYTQTTNAMVVQFTIAVNRPYAKPEDEVKADFIQIIAWNKTAEFCSKYFKKGQQIGVTGRIETGKYEDKDGKTVFTTKVVAEHVYFADSRKDEYNDPFAAPADSSKSTSVFKPITDDDLPF